MLQERLRKPGVLVGQARLSVRRRGNGLAKPAAAVYMQAALTMQRRDA